MENPKKMYCVPVFEGKNHDFKKTIVLAEKSSLKLNQGARSTPYIFTRGVQNTLTTYTPNFLTINLGDLSHHHVSAYYRRATGNLYQLLGKNRDTIHFNLLPAAFFGHPRRDPMNMICLSIMATFVILVSQGAEMRLFYCRRLLRYPPPRNRETNYKGGGRQEGRGV